MVQAVTVLTVMKMMIKVQTACSSGSINGTVMYERLPNIELQAFHNYIVRGTAPPLTVFEKCQDLCLRDRTFNNTVRKFSSFDFQPGSRIVNYNNESEYEESTCYLASESAKPESSGNLTVVYNSLHFTEICITSSRPKIECPNRKYVFERHPRKKLKLPNPHVKELTASNRTECEDKCLNEFSFVCRSATFDSAMKTCTLSRFTRRTHPELLEDDPDSDYLENTCLNAQRRCDGLAVFIKEENKSLGGPFEVELFSNVTLEDCQVMCVCAEKYFCRSIEYDEITRECTLSDEDSISQQDDIGISNSPTHHIYDFTCLDSRNNSISAPSSEYSDNSVTSHLFNGKKSDTAFQRYRNSRLGGEHYSEIFGRSLSECIDECLRQSNIQCRSADYSERYRICRLTRYNQRDGMRIIHDENYDYYENMLYYEDFHVTEKDDYGSPSDQIPDRYIPDGFGSSTHRFYDVTCLDTRGSEYPDNSIKSHLCPGKTPDTVFQRYRSSRLGGEHHSEFSGRSLSECLLECLRLPGIQCRSVEYSEKYRTCRLTRYNQRDGLKIIYDVDYDYYDNLMCL